MKITVIGTGYVGLVTGVCLCDIGFDVTCVDVDDKKIDNLNLGEIPIYEPGLGKVLARGQERGQLHFTTDLPVSVAQADIVFIAVGTPQGDDGRSDLSYVETAARQIACSLEGQTLIIVKSTVPVGTCTRIERIIARQNPDAEFSVVSNPEFLREGSAVRDFKRPDRIVVGVRDAQARATMEQLYASFTDDGVAIVFTTLETSELIKYSANAFLATKVAFINEMANLCDSVGADVEALSEALGLDERIGKAFLKPGPGYGGSCFPKDTLALTIQAQEADCPVHIVESVVASNSFHIRRLGKRIAEFCARSWHDQCNGNIDLSGKKIAVLGLAFKANTDDIRSAASTVIIPLLQKQGANIVAYDPQAMETAKTAIPDLETAASVIAATRDADAVLMLTEWEEFRDIDWASLVPAMRSPVVIDFRNLYNRYKMAEQGIDYYSLGRPAINGEQIAAQSG